MKLKLIKDGEKRANFSKENKDFWLKIEVNV